MIQHEPLLAYQDNHLVMVVDHVFADVPSWVEWDSERKIFSITEMDGQTSEVSATMRDEYLSLLQKSRKLLLVSNSNEEKIVHYVSFISRQ